MKKVFISMVLRKMLIIILITSIRVQVSEAVKCTSDFCEKVHCHTVTCGPHQILRQRADACGCCDVCTALLEIGDPCISLRGPPATAQCGKYLVCMHRRCIPMYRVNHHSHQ
ncbi:unnamed protein product [Larinioides sclopetarius]|uniref:Uncharacterized protein n=1 Tax=Larinioides sclopetarius TaxID=280406 RepID=A0AAV2BFX8_9ARAC